MSESEMRQVYVHALEVRKIEFIQRDDTGDIVIRFTLEDGSVAVVSVKDYSFVTATTLSFA